MTAINPTYSEMPSEIKEYITNFLPGKDVLKLAQVDRELARHYSDANVVTWKRKCEEEYPNQTLPPNTTWKRHYINLHQYNLPFNRGYREGFNSAPTLGRRIGSIASILGIMGVSGTTAGVAAISTAAGVAAISTAAVDAGVVAGIASGVVAGIATIGSAVAVDDASAHNAVSIVAGIAAGVAATSTSVVVGGDGFSTIGTSVVVASGIFGAVAVVTSGAFNAAVRAAAQAVAQASCPGVNAAAHAATKIINKSSNLGEKVASLSPVRKLCGIIQGSGEYLKSKTRG